MMRSSPKYATRISTILLLTFLSTLSFTASVLARNPVVNHVGRRDILDSIFPSDPTGTSTTPAVTPTTTDANDAPTATTSSSEDPPDASDTPVASGSDSSVEQPPSESATPTSEFTTASSSPSPSLSASATSSSSSSVVDVSSTLTRTSSVEASSISSSSSVDVSTSSAGSLSSSSSSSISSSSAAVTTVSATTATASTFYTTPHPSSTASSPSTLASATDGASTSSSSSTSFWDNKGQVGVTFAIVGLTIVGIGAALFWFLRKRQQSRRRDVQEEFFEKYPEQRDSEHDMTEFEEGNVGMAVSTVDLTAPAEPGAYPDRAIHYGIASTQPYYANDAMYTPQAYGMEYPPENLYDTSQEMVQGAPGTAYAAAAASAGQQYQYTGYGQTQQAYHFGHDYSQYEQTAVIQHPYSDESHAVKTNRAPRALTPSTQSAESYYPSPGASPGTGIAH